MIKCQLNRPNKTSALRFRNSGWITNSFISWVSGIFSCVCVWLSVYVPFFGSLLHILAIKNVGSRTGCFTVTRSISCLLLRGTTSAFSSGVWKWVYKHMHVHTQARKSQQVKRQNQDVKCLKCVEEGKVFAIISMK